MKNVLLTLLALAMIMPLVSQDYNNAGMDFTKAMYDNKTPEARISAFQNYLKTYTDLNNKFVRLAHYQLAINFFEAKKYKETVDMAKKALGMKLGEIDPGAEARVTLVLANAYGIRSAETFNQPEALKYATKAIELGQKCDDPEVVKTAEQLKEKVSAPPPKQMTPLQKFQYAISEDSWQEAITEFKGLSADEKADSNNRYLYVNALINARQEAAAVKELEAMYAAAKEARVAKKLAEIYMKRAKKNNPDSYNAGVDMYLETGLLYQKEGNSKSSKAALDLAMYELGNKYGFNDAVKKVNAEAARGQQQAAQNKERIRKLEYEIRLEERRIRRQYQDIEPPPYELEKIEKMKKQLAAAKSGASTQTTDAAEKLAETKKQIDSEYNSRLAEARNRIK